MTKQLNCKNHKHCGNKGWEMDCPYAKDLYNTIKKVVVCLACYDEAAAAL